MLIQEYGNSSCNVMCHVVKKLKSHEGSQRVTKGNVKSHPTLCYKQNLITHRIGFWEPIFWLGLGLEKSQEYYDEPWTLHNVERVYFFERACVLDCNVPLLGLVIINGVCMDGTFTYNNTTEPSRFHAYVVIIVGLFQFLQQCMLFNLCIFL